MSVVNEQQVRLIYSEGEHCRMLQVNCNSILLLDDQEKSQMTADGVQADSKLLNSYLLSTVIS